MEILGTTSENVAISLEASSNSIRNLLGVLTSGVTFTKEEGNFGEAIRTAELIGISVENWQIGKKKANPNSGTGVETRGLRNTNQSNNDRKIEKVKKSKIKHGTKLDKGHWMCDICGYKAKPLTTIQKHIKTHSNKHKYACSRCFYTFKNGKSLDDHISIAHMNSSNDKETAEDCSKNRDESENLKLWTRKSIGWSCNICGHCTSRKKKVLVHIQTHLNSFKHIRTHSFEHIRRHSFEHIRTHSFEHIRTHSSRARPEFVPNSSRIRPEFVPNSSRTRPEFVPTGRARDDIRTHWNTFETCSNTFEHVRTHSNTFELVRTHSNTFEHVQTRSNTFEHV